MNNQKIWEFNLKLIKAPRFKNAAYVVIPIKDLKTTFGKGNLVPVQILFEHHIQYRSSLSKMDKTTVILVVPIVIQNKMNKYAGDIINVKIQHDNENRTIELPNYLTQKIKENNLLDVGNQLSYSKQKEQLDKYLHAKRETTKQKYLTNILQLLNHKKRLQKNSIN